MQFKSIAAYLDYIMSDFIENNDYAEAQATRLEFLDTGVIQLVFKYTKEPNGEWFTENLVFTDVGELQDAARSPVD